MSETTYRLTADIPLSEEYEVIVVGGGPSGCAAAAAAARDGAKTLLIEATASLGGMGTNGLVPFWCGFTNGGPLCSTGIGKQVLEACRARMWKGARGDGNNYAIDAEALKRVYDDLVTEAGAEILFCTMLSAVQTDGQGRVTEIIVSNKAGLTAYRAKVFVDTTGDADLVAWAGGEFALGDELGEMQAGTLCFTLTGADMDAYRKVKTHRVIYPNPEGEYPLIPDDHCVTAAVGEGAVGFNAGHLVEVDGTDRGAYPGTSSSGGGSMRRSLPASESGSRRPTGTPISPRPRRCSAYGKGGASWATIRSRSRIISPAGPFRTRSRATTTISIATRPRPSGNW